MEALGAAASAEALLELSLKLFKVGSDIWHAGKEKQQYQNMLDGLKEQLQSLTRLQQAAQGHAEQIYYDGLFRVAQKGKPSIGKQQGALISMAKAMQRMQHELRQRNSFERKLVRLKWTLDKEKFRGMLVQIQEWQSQVQFAMQQDQLDLALKTFKLESDTNNRVQGLQRVAAETQGTTHKIALLSGSTDERTQRIESVEEDTNARIKSVQADTLALRARKERKDRKLLYEAIANWLSRLDFNTRQSEIFDRCIDTSQGLLESPEFQAWQSGRHWILFCWADAGAGKTMFSSMVVEHLRDQFKEKNVPVLCMYLNYKEQNSQDPRTLIGSLLKQLVQYKSYASCSDDLVRRYREKPKGTSLGKKDMQAAFCSEILRYERVFVVVDALDEGSLEVRRFYQDIMQLLPLDRLSVMVTSRDRPPEAVQGILCDGCDQGPLNIFFRCQDCIEPFDLCYDCNKIGKMCGRSGHFFIEQYEGEEVYLCIDPSDEVIGEYVRNEIHGEVQTHRRGRVNLGISKSQPGTTLLGRLCRKNPELEQSLIDTICLRAGGKFMLAKLFIDSLPAKNNLTEINRALEQLPKGYTGMYETTMERIKSYSAKDPESDATSLAITTLSWIVHTHRPLDLVELQHALAIKPGREIQEADIYDKETLLEKTAGLVVVESDDQAVRMSHYTAQEYFLGPGQKWFSLDADSTIARACLCYLSSKDLSAPCDRSREDEEIEERKQQFPFLCYAYEYWGIHAKDAAEDSETNADVLAFLKDRHRVAAFVQAIWYLESAESAKWEIRKGANALHVAAWFGLTNVLADLLEEGLDINAKDPGHEQTPLIYACRRGHSDTVAELLELGASINSRSARGSTALVEGVMEKHLGVVEILLKQYNLNINETQPWDFGRTVLMLAVMNDSLEIVSALLDRDDISINQKDSEGYTALMLATAFGRINIVEVLLAHPKIDVDVTSRYGTTALFCAAACIKETGTGVASMLLDHGVSTSIQDRQGGGTAIIRATDNGNISMVEMLLDRGVDVAETDLLGRGILHAAAVSGHTDIAELVIEKGLSINIKDKMGRTPLHDAGRFGNVATIQRLLELGADVRHEDSSGRTPATVAWQNGKRAAFDLLSQHPIAQGEKNHMLPPESEHLPTWSLAKLGFEDLIARKIAQRTKDPFVLSHLDPDTEETPIHCAILGNHPSILRRLLAAGLSPDTQNASFRSPLHHAAINPNKNLMQILLTAHPNLNPKNESGVTPLWLAYIANYQENALFLVEAGANIEEKALILPLFFSAIEFGCLDAVRILIEKHKAPVLAKNKRGESALQVAKARGFVDIQRLLDGNKSLYQRDMTLSVNEAALLDLETSVKGHFTRPEVWEEEAAEPEIRKMLEVGDFPSVNPDEIQDKSIVEGTKVLVATV